MNILSIFAWTVYAAEMIISPLPDTAVVASPPKPQATFGQLISPLPDNSQVLGETVIAIPSPSREKQSLEIAAPYERSRDDNIFNCSLPRRLPESSYC